MDPGESDLCCNKYHVSTSEMGKEQLYPLILEERLAITEKISAPKLHILFQELTWQIKDRRAVREGNNRTKIKNMISKIY